MNTKEFGRSVQEQIRDTRDSILELYYFEALHSTDTEQHNRLMDIASDDVNELRLRLEAKLAAFLRIARNSGKEVQADHYARSLARIRSSRDMMEFINQAIGVFGIADAKADDNLPF
jgi:hypothetical protein